MSARAMPCADFMRQCHCVRTDSSKQYMHASHVLCRFHDLMCGVIWCGSSLADVKHDVVLQTQRRIKKFVDEKKSSLADVKNDVVLQTNIILEKFVSVENSSLLDVKNNVFSFA